MQDETLKVEFGGVQSDVSMSDGETLDSIETVQNKIIQCIKSHAMEPPELPFSIFVNSASDPEEFSPLTNDSFSNLSWWRGAVLRVEPSPQPDGMTEEKDDSSNEQVIQHFDVELKLDEVQFSIDRSHLSESIEEVCEIIDISGIECSILATILSETTITNEQMQLWAGYGGGSALFHSQEQVQSSLKNMIDYATNPPTQHGRFITEKMKTIGHVLSQPDARERYDVPQILLYLASHGMACPVLKEVAIDMTYSLLTGAAEEFVRRQSLKNTILRGLRECRYNIVEELYSAFDGTENNIHGIAMLNNYLSDNIEGIPKIEDPNISNWGLPSDWQTGLVDKFYVAYTTERCLKAVISCVKEKKIGYQQVVEWFEVRAPPSDKYEFLGQVFDMDTGAISELHLSWMLCQMSIFRMGDENSDVSG